MSRQILFQAFLLAALWHGLVAKARAKTYPQHQIHTAPSASATPVTIQNYNIQGPVKLAHDSAQVHVNDYNEARSPYVEASYSPGPNRHRGPPYIVVTYDADLRNPEQSPASPASTGHHANSNSAPSHRPYYITAPYYNHQGYQTPVYSAPVSYQGHGYHHDHHQYGQQQVRPTYQEVPVYHQPVHRVPLYQPQRVQQQAQPWVHSSPSQTVIYNATHTGVRQQQSVGEATGKPRETIPVVNAQYVPLRVIQMKPQAGQVVKALASPAVSKITVQASPQLPVDDAVESLQMAGKGQVVAFEPHPTLVPVTPIVALDEEIVTSDVAGVAVPEVKVVVDEPVEGPLQQNETSTVKEDEATTEETTTSSEPATTTEQEITEATPTTVAPLLTEVKVTVADPEAATTQEPMTEETVITGTAGPPVTTIDPAMEAVQVVPMAVGEEVTAEPSSASEKDQATIAKSPLVPLIYRKRMEAEKNTSSVSTMRPSTIPLIYRSDVKVAQKYDMPATSEMVGEMVGEMAAKDEGAAASAGAEEAPEAPAEGTKVKSSLTHQQAQMQKTEDRPLVKSPLPSRPYPTATKRNPGFKTVIVTKTSTVLPASSFPARAEYVRQRQPATVQRVVSEALPIDEPASEEAALESLELFHSLEDEREDEYYEEHLKTRPAHPAHLANRNKPDKAQSKINNRRPYPINYGKQSAAPVEVRQSNEPIRGRDRNSPVVPVAYPVRLASKSRAKHSKVVASSQVGEEMTENESKTSCTLLDEIQQALLSDDEQHQLPPGVVLDRENSRAILPGGFFLYYMEDEETHSRQHYSCCARVSLQVKSWTLAC